MTERATIHVECVLPHSPARVWSALTDSEQLAQWLMPNDFVLAVGHHFTFTTDPVPAVEFNGVVNCEVLDFTPERRLHISWTSYGPHGLVSTVTWLLEPVEGGTSLSMDHSGFDLNNPLQAMSFKMMSGGWKTIGPKLDALLAGQSVAV